jgi:hypothetical protein
MPFLGSGNADNVIFSDSVLVLLGTGTKVIISDSVSVLSDAETVGDSFVVSLGSAFSVVACSMTDFGAVMLVNVSYGSAERDSSPPGGVSGGFREFIR